MIDQLSQRLGRVEGSLERIEETNERIARSLEKLVILETQFAEHRSALDRAFGAVKELHDEIDELREIIDKLKEKQPLINLVLMGMGTLAIMGIGGLCAWIWNRITA